MCWPKGQSWCTPATRNTDMESKSSDGNSGLQRQAPIARETPEERYVRGRAKCMRDFKTGWPRLSAAEEERLEKWTRLEYFVNVYKRSINTGPYKSPGSPLEILGKYGLGSLDSRANWSWSPGIGSDPEAKIRTNSNVIRGFADLLLGMGELNKNRSDGSWEYEVYEHCIGYLEADLIDAKALPPLAPPVPPATPRPNVVYGSYQEQSQALRDSLASSPYGNLDFARADLKKQCASEIKAKLGTDADAKEIVNVKIGNALYFGEHELQTNLQANKNRIQNSLTSKSRIDRIDAKLDLCLIQQRLWQAQSAQSSKTVSTSSALAPLRVPAPTVAVAPELPSRVIARDGRTALECVKLVNLTQSNSRTSGLGGSVLANQCTDTVEIGWCSTGGECERGHGNQTTLLSGRSWPVDANHEVRWGACHGANTFHGDSGSKGLKFTCSAPKSGE